MLRSKKVSVFGFLFLGLASCVPPLQVSLPLTCELRNVVAAYGDGITVQEEESANGCNNSNQATINDSLTEPSYGVIANVSALTDSTNSVVLHQHHLKAENGPTPLEYMQGMSTTRHSFTITEANQVTFVISYQFDGSQTDGSPYDALDVFNPSLRIYGPGIDEFLNAGSSQRTLQPGTYRVEAILETRGSAANSLGAMSVQVQVPNPAL